MPNLAEKAEIDVVFDEDIETQPLREAADDIEFGKMRDVRRQTMLPVLEFMTPGVPTTAERIRAGWEPTCLISLVASLKI